MTTERRKKKLRDPQAKREATKYERPIASRELILQLLNEQGEPMSYEEIASFFELTDEDGREALRRRLIAMVRDGQLLLNRREGYVPVDSENLIRGRVIAHPDGFGFLVPDEGGDDVYLSPREMRQLLHGDRAVVFVTGLDRRGRREGSVAEILSRANETLVGRIVAESGVVELVPDHKRINQEVLIAPEHANGARHGQIAVVDIIEQPTRRRQPIGRVREILGDRLQPGMETDIAINSYGIPAEWPAAVEDQVGAMPDEVPEADKKGRKDLRRLPLVTIDGADSKDFDDAVFCEPCRDGSWRLVVAIADVAHYVPVDTPLDAEAERRATSVYFPNRVVPMLPEKLSNGLCSLNPEVDRLCLACDMRIDSEGRIQRSRFQRAVMRSHARLTYDDVADVLLHDDAAARARHDKLIPHLENLHRLFRVLFRARQRRGALEFDSVETQIHFDDNGRIARIEPYERNDAHLIIEECMIAANVATARYLQHHKLPALYRVHDGPQSDRLEDLRTFLNERGLHLEGGDQPEAGHFAEVMRAAKERPDRHMIQMAMLRTLSQAVYQPECSGHFGLALDEYAHFTSPIRRYPDLLVHRAIHHRLAGGRPRNYVHDHDDMVRFGEHCSMAERRADEATRDVEQVLKCQFMEDRVGEDFDGIITGVTSFGLFVELQETFTEGLVHVTSLARDFYRFDPVGHSLIGDRSGRTYRVGDSLRVRVVRVDVDERKIDFEPLDKSAGDDRKGAADTGGGRKPAKKKAGGRKKKGSAQKDAEAAPAGADGDGKKSKKKSSRRRRSRG